MRHHTWDPKTGCVPVSRKRMLFGLNLKKTLFFPQKSDQRAGWPLGNTFVWLWPIPRHKSGDRSNLARRSVTPHENHQIRPVLGPCDWPVDRSDGRLAILYGYWDRKGVRGGCPGPSHRHPTIAGCTTRADARARDGRLHGFLLWFPGMMNISERERQASVPQESLPGAAHQLPSTTEPGRLG